MSDVDELVKKLTSGQWTTMEVFEAADALTAQQAEIERLREDGQFLLDRLSEVELADDMPQDFLRDWMGHVEPAIARFRAALTGKEGGDG